MSQLVIPATIDSYLDESDIDSGTLHNDKPSCVVSMPVWPVVYARKRPVFGFNLTPLPNQFVISAAVLSYHMITNLPGSCMCQIVPLLISPVLSPGRVPIDGGVSWARRNEALDVWEDVEGGGDYEPTQAITFFPPPASPGLKTHNVEAMIEWALAALQYKAQVGLMIFQVSGTPRTWEIASTENISGFAVPTLTITYTEGSSSENNWRLRRFGRSGRFGGQRN